MKKIESEVANVDWSTRSRQPQVNRQDDDNENDDDYGGFANDNSSDDDDDHENDEDRSEYSETSRRR